MAHSISPWTRWPLGILGPSSQICFVSAHPPRSLIELSLGHLVFWLSRCMLCSSPRYRTFTGGESPLVIASICGGNSKSALSFRPFERDCCRQRGRATKHFAAASCSFYSPVSGWSIVVVLHLNLSTPSPGIEHLTESYRFLDLGGRRRSTAPLITDLSRILLVWPRSTSRARSYCRDVVLEQACRAPVQTYVVDLLGGNTVVIQSAAVIIDAHGHPDQRRLAASVEAQKPQLGDQRARTIFCRPAALLSEAQTQRRCRLGQLGTFLSGFGFASCQVCGGGELVGGLKLGVRRRCIAILDGRLSPSSQLRIRIRLRHRSDGREWR